MCPIQLTVNPTLEEHSDDGGVQLTWRHPETGAVQVRRAGPAELATLHMARNGVSEEEAAEAGGIHPNRVAAFVDQVIAEGLVLAPPPGLHRTEEDFPLGNARPDMLRCGRFTLQWHLTNACDLHCAHCYDRTKMRALKLPDTLRILRDFEAFCRSKRMAGDVCLSGGNPLLYPRFMELYQAVADTDMSISILGNPCSREELEALCAVRAPEHFQVSLEGLEPNTSRIRGPEHWGRVEEFLPLLAKLGIESGIMLTLTRDNLDDAIPLAGWLRDRADSYAFNRLAQVGQGAALAVPTGERYRSFLAEWEAAAETNPVMRLKDNLFNIDRAEQGYRLSDGCTGFGCGAAFNFVAVLPHGEVHACRKFPSPIGRVPQQTLEAIWESAAAQKYRTGCTACRDCPIRANCGGCLAVSHGAGLDPFTERDPHCWLGPT